MKCKAIHLLFPLLLSIIIGTAWPFIRVELESSMKIDRVTGGIKQQNSSTPQYKLKKKKKIRGNSKFSMKKLSRKSLNQPSIEPTLEDEYDPLATMARKKGSQNSGSGSKKAMKSKSEKKTSKSKSKKAKGGSKGKGKKSSSNQSDNIFDRTPQPKSPKLPEPTPTKPPQMIPATTENPVSIPIRIPTLTPSGIIPDSNQTDNNTVELDPYFIAYVSRTLGGTEPTPQQYQEVLDVTDEYVTQYLKEYYEAIDDTVQIDNVQSQLGNSTGINKGIPEPRYNIYMDYISDVIFSPNSTRIPDATEIYEILKESIDPLYTAAIRSIPDSPFSSVTQTFTETIQNGQNATTTPTINAATRPPASPSTTPAPAPGPPSTTPAPAPGPPSTTPAPVPSPTTPAPVPPPTTPAPIPPPTTPAPVPPPTTPAPVPAPVPPPPPTTPQPTNPPTSPPSILPTNPLPYQDLKIDDYYVAYNVSGIVGDDDKPTPDDYEEIRNATEQYLNAFFQDHYADNDTIVFDRIETSLGNKTSFDAGIPSDGYEIYVEFLTNLVFALNSKLPSSNETFALVKEALEMSTYYTDYVSLATNGSIFDNVTNGVMERIPNGTSSESSLVVPIKDYYISYSINPPPKRKPFTAEYDQVLNITNQFFTEYFTELYNGTNTTAGDSGNGTVKFDQSESFFISPPRFNASIPNESFAVYMEYKTNLVFANGSLLPDTEETYQLMKTAIESNFSDYLADTLSNSSSARGSPFVNTSGVIMNDELVPPPSDNDTATFRGAIAGGYYSSADGGGAFAVIPKTTNTIRKNGLDLFVSLFDNTSGVITNEELVPPPRDNDTAVSRGAIAGGFYSSAGGGGAYAAVPTTTNTIRKNGLDLFVSLFRSSSSKTDHD